MNLSSHPLVVRSRFRSILPDDSDVSFQFTTSEIITVFVKDPTLIDSIPKTFENKIVRIICISPDH